MFIHIYAFFKTESHYVKQVGLKLKDKPPVLPPNVGIKATICGLSKSFFSLFTTFLLPKQFHNFKSLTL